MRHPGSRWTLPLLVSYQEPLDSGFHRQNRRGNAFQQVSDLDPEGDSNRAAMTSGPSVRLYRQGRGYVAGARTPTRGPERPDTRREIHTLSGPDRSNLVRLVDPSSMQQR